MRNKAVKDAEDMKETLASLEARVQLLIKKNTKLKMEKARYKKRLTDANAELRLNQSKFSAELGVARASAARAKVKRDAARNSLKEVVQVVDGLYAKNREEKKRRRALEAELEAFKAEHDNKRAKLT